MRISNADWDFNQWSARPHWTGKYLNKEWPIWGLASWRHLLGEEWGKSIKRAGSDGENVCFEPNQCTWSSISGVGGERRACLGADGAGPRSTLHGSGLRSDRWWGTRRRIWSGWDFRENAASPAWPCDLQPGQWTQGIVRKWEGAARIFEWRRRIGYVSRVQARDIIGCGQQGEFPKISNIHGKVRRLIYRYWIFPDTSEFSPPILMLR